MEDLQATCTNIDDKKTVTFAPDTNFDRATPRCAICAHRNISPQIRYMAVCGECNCDYCHLCGTSLGLCLRCDKDIFESESDTESVIVAEDGDDRDPFDADPHVSEDLYDTFLYFIP
jgi:hypothetical protein